MVRHDTKGTRTTRPGADGPDGRTPPRGPPLILLPTLNEEAGLRATLEELRAVRDFPGDLTPTILVVDGRSTDRTRSVAMEFHCLLLLQTGRGKGAAVREGLDWAIANGFGSVAVLDADGTYPCDRIPTMIQLLEHEADLVAGVRRPTDPSDSTARNLVHRVGNGILNLGAALLSRGPILDVCTGFWGVRASVVPALALESNGFEVESELFVKAMRQKLRFAQMPVEYRPRIGDAKLHALRDGARILLSIVRHSGSSPQMPEVAREPSPATPAPGPAPSLAWALPTVLASFPASSILIVSGPSRYPEALQVVRSVGAQQPGVRVSMRFAPFDPAPEARGSGASGPDERPLVVTLPDPEPGQGVATAALLSVPSVGRTLLVEDGESGGPLVEQERPRLATFWPEPGVLRPPGAFRILQATLDSSGIQKQLALVAANSTRARLRVSELAAPDASIGPPPGALRFPSTPVSPGFAGGR